MHRLKDAEIKMFIDDELNRMTAVTGVSLGPMPFIDERRPLQQHQHQHTRMAYTTIPRTPDYQQAYLLFTRQTQNDRKLCVVAPLQSNDIYTISISVDRTLFLGSAFQVLFNLERKRILVVDTLMYCGQPVVQSSDYFTRNIYSLLVGASVGFGKSNSNNVDVTAADWMQLNFDDYRGALAEFMPQSTDLSYLVVMNSYGCDATKYVVF